MITILIIVALFSIAYLAHIWMLRVGARWAGVPDISFLKALKATVAMSIISRIVYAVILQMETAPDASPLVLGTLELSVTMLLSWLTIMVLFRTSFGRAVKTWLPTVVVTGMGIAFVYLVMKPYMLTAYVMPTHSMAPNLIGPHQRGTCPHCGKSATVHADPRQNQPGFEGRFREKRLGMCESCQQAGEITKLDPTIESGDRFFTNRMITPQRWDIITYHIQNEQVPPNVEPFLYAKRLIGLPGEEITIKSGGIWINGIRLDPPAELAKLTYESAAGPDAIGEPAPEFSIKLAANEYFVLGDFSKQSADSRSTGPIRGEDIDGVVTVIYFPIARWRILR